MTDPIKAKIIELCPDIALRVLLVDKRKPKQCNLTLLAHKEGLRPPRLAGDNQIGLVVGESKDKKCWYVSWFKADGITLMYRQTYHKDFIQVHNEQDEDPPIGIADVLRATEGKWRTMYAVSYDFGIGKNQLPEGQVLYALCSKWNLQHDNYDQQSEECKTFVGSLLGVNN